MTLFQLKEPEKWEWGFSHQSFNRFCFVFNNSPKGVRRLP